MYAELTETIRNSCNTYLILGDLQGDSRPIIQLTGVVVYLMSLYIIYILKMCLWVAT